jgi:hypothetical protein
MPPFAKIGRDTWVPIEMLRITNCQILRGWGNYTRELQESARRFWDVHGQSRIATYGNKLIRTTLEKDEVNSPNISGQFEVF